MKLLVQKQWTVSLSYNNKSSQNISIFLLGSIPTWQCRQYQVTLAYVIDCVTEEESMLSEPRYFIMGINHACPLFGREKLFIFQSH